MRNVSEDNITDTFLSYFGDDTSPRLKEVMTSLATHLHDFVKETKLTHEEWNIGLDILRRAGRISDDERDEFVLLSDVLGISSLVDMVNTPEVGTSSSVLGPFHISNPPKMPMGADLRGDYDGELVLVEGRVLDTEGNPIANATLDIWQTAPNGLYSSQDPEQDTYSFHALFTTESDGAYRFTTVRPVSYTVPTDGPVGDLLTATGRHPWRPSHLHYIIKADGFKSLVTEVFPDNDPYLDQDTVFGVRSDLVMTYEKQAAGSFPVEGFEISGNVEEAYSRVTFDLVLSRLNPI
ncbi:MAG: hydroxyquinol 1,2-dioxygenase [Gammaproteobacteria bacterium]|nr:hydroxyquinol 1,2-dioxygenase [Gammaproteobacteria bacterium]